MTEDVVPPLRNPPAAAWEVIRPIFLDLYLRQDKTLDEVRHHLQTRHHFTASTKAYKLRIKKWSAFKYRKRQKPRVGAFAGHGSSVSAKIRTDRSQSGTKAANWGGQIVRFSDGPSTRGFSAEEFTNSRIRMGQRIQDTSPYLYSATRDFWRWTIGSTSSPKSDHVWSSHLAPGWALIDVVTLLSMPSHHRRGRTKLLQVQDMIVSSIETAPAATLLAIIALFTFDKWHPYPGVQAVLFNFIKSYSLRCLPLDHPLRKILEHAKFEDMPFIAGQLFVVQVDTLMQIQAEGGDFPDWFFFAPTLGLIQARLLSDAHRVSMVRLQRAESRLKRCRILQLIIRCQFYGRDYDGCIQNGLWIIEMIKELQAEGNFVWGDLVSIYDIVAKCYAGKFQWDKSIKYCWLAFKDALEQYGKYSTNVHYFCHELETTLIDHGSPNELAALKSDYSFMFSDDPAPITETAAKHAELQTNRAHLISGTFSVEQALKALIDFG